MRNWIDLCGVLSESAPRTLYHGTLKDNIPSISANGLTPVVGDFVSNFYDPSGEEGYDAERDALEPLVFAAGKKDLQRCVNAIRHRLQAQGIRPTPDNIIEHGAIVVIRDEHDMFDHRPHDDQYGVEDPHVEPGDYYAYEDVEPSFIVTGAKLRDLLRRSRIAGFYSLPPTRGQNNALRESVAPKLLSFPILYHVGDMDPSGKRMDSHEGGGLSVSLHPRAWRQIARGWVGGDLWALTKPSNQFLDMHALTKSNKSEIRRWASEEGLIESALTYRFYYFDDEMDAEVYQEFDDKEEAEREAEVYDAPIKTINSGFIGTPTLNLRCKQSGSALLNPWGFIAGLWAEDVLQVDGVWWEDRLSPRSYSAPRGMIFASRLPEWRAERTLDWPDEDDHA
jgi:hypothetical protein